MTPTHHPEADELLGYASGAAPDWISLVVACHLTYCERCRREVALLEDLGGALLSSLEDEREVGGGTPARPRDDVLRAAKTPAKPPTPATVVSNTAASAKIPRPLHGFFADEPRFRFLAPGVRHIPLSFSVGGVPARIVRFAPGFVVPEHAHTGVEMVLVLDGELTDGATNEVFVSGDLSKRDAGTAHTQRVTGGDACTCLVVSAAPIVPATFWGKVLKALTGV